MEGASASSSPEVLLVRCPMCANLLPELPDLPVYSCGCCGAVLAKRKGLVEGGLSNGENVGVGFGQGSVAMKLDNYYERDERGGNGGLEAINRNRTVDLHNYCSTSRSQNIDVLADCVGIGKREPISARARFGQCTSNRSINRGEYGSSKHNLDVDDWACRNDAPMNIGHHGYVDSRTDNGNWGPEGNVSLGSRGYPMDASARQKRGMNYEPLEASSKCDPYIRSRDGSSGFDRVLGLEKDRAELLRKIGELNDQLRRACDVAEKPNKVRSALLESRIDYSCSHDVSREGLFGVNKQPLGQGHRVVGPPCVARGYQYSPQMYPNGCHDPSMDISSRPLRRRPHKSPFKPACSCPNCFTQNWEALPAFGNERSQAHTSDNLVYNQQRLTRSSSGTRAKIDLDRPRKVILAISGGAPFITCCNCFEVLRLPWKLRRMGKNKNKNKMKCGACSSIFVCELISGKGMILPVPEQSAKLSKQSPGDQKPNSGIVAGKDSSLTSEFPNTNDASLHFSDYPHHHSSYRSSNDGAERYVNVSEWCNEKGVKENYVKDVSVATEIDISMNESANSCVSVESFDARKDDENGSEVSKSSQNAEERRSNVFVNGQLIPVAEVKRAEKLAGPIQLGEYWYDVRAGFWGVIGHPCLGIIPPNIEEFNYPMPKHCAAGNTGVFVNGRELHKKDLDILVNRGLPVKEHKSYLIDISGKVVDEQTGEELHCLGKLAATVERVGHGFGMKVPKWILEQSN